MEFETLVSTRRSVRGYKKDPVPCDVIDEIIAVAKGAPSSMIFQPWQVHVLTGAPLEEVRRHNMGGMAASENQSATFSPMDRMKARIGNVR